MCVVVAGEVDPAGQLAGHQRGGRLLYPALETSERFPCRSLINFQHFDLQKVFSLVVMQAHIRHPFLSKGVTFAPIYIL